MKKYLFLTFAVILAALVTSCKKQLEGEVVDTKYYTLIVPEGWKQLGSTNKDMNVMITNDIKVGEEGHKTIAFLTTEKRLTSTTSDPAEMLKYALKYKNAEDKGCKTFNGNKYYSYYQEEYKKLTMLVQLADSAYMRVEVKGADIDDEELGVILDNVTIKEVAGEASEDAKAAAEGQAEQIKEGPGTLEAQTYSIDVPEGWKVMKAAEKTLIITNKKPGEGMITTDRYTMKFDGKIESLRSQKDIQELGEKTFGSNKFLVFHDKMNRDIAVMDLGDGNGYITVFASNIGVDNSVLQKVLESIKVK